MLDIQTDKECKDWCMTQLTALGCEYNHPICTAHTYPVSKQTKAGSLGSCFRIIPGGVFCLETTKKNHKKVNENLSLLTKI